MAQQDKKKKSSSLAAIMQQLLSHGQGDIPNYLASVNAQQSAKDPQYAAGMAIGKILNALGQNWLENYLARGQMKERNPEQPPANVMPDQKQAAIDKAVPVPDIGKLLEANNNITNAADDNEDEYLRRLQRAPYPFAGGVR